MKKGVTISILAITIIVMFILVGTTTYLGVNNIQTAMYDEFFRKVARVSDAVNEYYTENKMLPTTGEIIAKEGLPNELVLEITKNNDTQNNLFVIDISKLRVESVNIGKGNVENLDVFIVAENTNNVYYLKGIEYKSNSYYGLIN